MIECKNPTTHFKGSAIDLLVELGLIIKSFYETDIESSVITDTICAIMKDSTDSLEIIKALSKPNLPKK